MEDWLDVGQIGTKLDKSGKFEDNLVIHYKSLVAYIKLILKVLICLILCLSGPYMAHSDYAALISRYLM